jgi:energy-coupling factor transporter ATP-binding protein EcfA2
MEEFPLGTYNAGIQNDDFTVDFSREAFRHALVIGKTGTGKSTLLRHIIAHAIVNRLGVWVLDPHGDLIDDALNYLPEALLKNIVFLDPENGRIPDLGLLDHPDPNRALRAFMTFIEAHAGTGWGPETARWLRNLGRAALELYTHPNLLHIYKLLVDDGFCATELKNCKHPITRKFYRQKFINMVKKDRIKEASHPLNKIEELMEEGLREFFCQEKHLNFRKLMDEQKIVLCRIPTSYLESRQARVLGSFILMKLKIEATRRKHRKRQVFIFADEYANWTDAIDVRAAFAESRKFGVHYIVTTQNLSQLRDEAKRIRNDSIVLGNVSHIFAFRLAADDADQIARNFGEEQYDTNLVTMEDFTYRALTKKRGLPVVKGPIEIQPYPKIDAKLVPGRKAAAWARENTGTPVADIARRIDKALEDPPEPRKRRIVRKSKSSLP